MATTGTKSEQYHHPADGERHTTTLSPDVEEGQEKAPTTTPANNNDNNDNDNNDDNENNNPSPAPDGGLEAWLTAAGGFCVFFCCLGFSNSFGTLADYYLRHQLRDRSPDDVAWIGSLSAFLQFFSGMVGGPLFDRFGVRVIRPAAIAYIFSMMMLSVCRTYWQFMLCQAVLMGTAMGLLQFPAIAAVSQHFDRHRAAALGLAVSGSSVGGIVIPVALSKMLNGNTSNTTPTGDGGTGSGLSFGWSIRIIGFLVLPLLAFALFTIKARLLPPRKRSFWTPAAFTDARLAILTASMFFVFMGMFMPLFFIPTYASSVRGMNPTLAGYLSAVLNASSTFGRIIPGVLADRLGKLNVYAAGALATGVVIFCMDAAVSDAALVAYAVVFGFTSGTIISGASAAFTVCCPNARDVGTCAGMGMAVGAIGGLIGPPLDGVLVDRYGGFFRPAMFSGAVCLFGGIVAFANKWWTPQGLWGFV